MKRSKVFNEIKSIISVRGPTQTTIETTNNILDKIEELGMIPFPICQYEEGFSHDKADELYGIFGWESEE